MIASYVGNLSIVKILVNAGANLNLASDRGLTAILLAAMKGHLEIVKFLCQKNAKTSHVMARATFLYKNFLKES